MKVTLNLGALEAKREGFNFTIKDGGDLKITASGIEYKAKGKRTATKVTWSKLGSLLEGDAAPKKAAAKKKSTAKKSGRPKKAATAKKATAKKAGRPKKAATVKKAAAKKAGRPKKTVTIKRKTSTTKKKLRAKK